MKTWMGLFLSMISLAAFGQQKMDKEPHTLLWEISGNGLQKSSYLFGTMHIVCSEDAMLSDSLRSVIHNFDAIYFEMDMDNLMEMLGIMGKMKMRDDTTLADLLDKPDYEKVKDFFKDK